MIASVNICNDNLTGQPDQRHVHPTHGSVRVAAPSLPLRLLLLWHGGGLARATWTEHKLSVLFPQHSAQGLSTHAKVRWDLMSERHKQIRRPRDRAQLRLLTLFLEKPNSSTTHCRCLQFLFSTDTELNKPFLCVAWPSSFLSAQFPCPSLSANKHFLPHFWPCNRTPKWAWSWRHTFNQGHTFCRKPI